MFTALQWFLFGMFIWGCCLLMSAISDRVTAAGPGEKRATGRSRHGWFGTGMEADEEADDAALREEIASLRKRVETLEAIVTDRKFQWEQDLNR